MYALRTTGVCVLLLAAAMSAAAPKQPVKPPEIALSDDGAKLLARYTSQQAQLQAAIAGYVPAMNEQKRAAFLSALETHKNAVEVLVAREKEYDKAIKAPEKSIGRAQSSLKKATDALAEGETKLAEATAAVKAGENQENAKALKAAEQQLIKLRKNAESSAAALKANEEAIAAAKADEPRYAQTVQSAKDALTEAQKHLREAFAAIYADLSPFLASNQSDSTLLKFIVLAHATPRGLAEFAQQGAVHAGLVDKLLADDALMLEMVVADGPADGRYGEAMKILADIQAASPRAAEGVFHRLAVATALAHAVPIGQANPLEKVDAPKFVDPVKRYMHFEKAYLNGELDPGFKDLTTWDYRMVVNGDEPDETLTWGRQMLRNYRPDHITNPDYRWRYVEAVKTEVRYGSQDVKNDLPSLQPYQNMIMNGGICGRRAFFGRFILRAFGIPTTARPQPGHAALVHWTPEGWVVNLGAGWGWGTTRTQYVKDVDFLAVTQARAVESAYLEVQRAYWVGDAMGEGRVYGMDGSPAFWNAVALCRRHEIIEQSKAVALAAVGTDIGEANVSKVKDVIRDVPLTDEDRKISIGGDGVISIPAVACSTPAASTAKIRFMPSQLGGKQLHYMRLGKPENFEYTFDAPAGKYALTARVVTTSANQHLFVAANGAADAIDIAVPFTIGQWETTPQVQITLVQGKNVLTFSRPDPVKGLTIRDFTLTPVK